MKRATKIQIVFWVITLVLMTLLIIFVVNPRRANASGFSGCFISTIAKPVPPAADDHFIELKLPAETEDDGTAAQHSIVATMLDDDNDGCFISTINIIP